VLVGALALRSQNSSLKGVRQSLCAQEVLASAENCANLIKGKTYPERLDVTNVQGIAVFMRLVAERHEHIDILINNTGYLLSA
jgi:NADP-dependent 3-hydroxy acid dehydrogenase YdfG